MKTFKITALAAILIAASAATAQSNQPHVPTDGDITLIHDCHTVYLDVEGTDMKPSHSTSFQCWQIEEPVFSFLSHEQNLTGQGADLYQMVLTDMRYFATNLDRFEMGEEYASTFAPHPAAPTPPLGAEQIRAVEQADAPLKAGDLELKKAVFQESCGVDSQAWNASCQKWHDEVSGVPTETCGVDPQAWSASCQLWDKYGVLPMAAKHKGRK
jgi:hypothetical protein